MIKLPVTVSAVIFLAGCLPAAGSSASRWIGLSRRGERSEATSRMVSLRSTADAATVGVSLPGFYLDEKELSDRRTYDVISAPGGGTHQVGRPDLPVFGEMILVPNGATPILEVEPGEALVVESLDIAPLQPPPTDAGRQPFAKDQGLYAGDADFPSVFAFLEPLARIRGRQASILWLYPYRYNPARRRLLIFPDLRVTVRFEGRRRGVAARLKSRPFDRLLGRVMINADAVLAGGEEVKSPRTSSGTEKIRASGTEGACEYLIVTHPDFLEAASALAAWKRKSGFSTFVATTSDTGDTAEEIAAYLQGAYDTWDPAPTYVLFIGDAEFIPTFYRTAHPNSGSLVGTDLYYATLDGSDYFPDIITGRISVDTAEQALKRVNDIIGYESDPVTDESFYASAAICAQFQHYTNGYAERRFAQTSEDLAIYLSDPAYLGQYSVERFYYTGSAVTPLYWSVFYFSGGPAGDAGDPIPSYLEKPGFAWDADAADISAAVNSGRFLLTHRDHGSATAWGSPYYSTSHVSALTNGEKLPVVWSVNCSTGFFDKETCANPASTVSFSEAWERNPSGGAAGVIAATRVSYSGHNDRLFWGWADAVWPDFVTGFSGPEISYRRMGDVLNYGKLYYATRYSESTYRKVEFEIFHWFGDPAMMIRTRLPETLAVSHPARVVQGVPVDFEVTVESGGSFVAGAAVAVYREDVPGDYRTAQTDETGTALFPGLTASEIGEYELVVTAPETIPYQGAFVALAAPSPTPAPSPSPSPVPWPGGWGTEIGASLPDGFEPSGLVWHERLGVLFIVGDGGQVVQMDEEGGEVVVWNPGGDLEGIAVADPASNYLYLGVEDPDSIREFNLAAGTLTGRSWSLTEWMSGPSNSGLEALTFVPNGHHPYPASASGGLFYAGLQADGKIYVFDVDLSAGESLSYVDTIVPVSGQTDLSGLHYHRENRTLYAVFDGADLLREMEADGTLIVEYPLAGNTQEGVALKPSCPSPATSLFIAEDAGNEIWRYDDYPVSCLAATPTPPAPTPGPSRTPVPPPTVPATSTPTGAPPGYCRQPLALNDITDARIGITRSSYNYGYKYEIFSAEEPGHDNRWFYLYDRVNVYHDGPGVPGSYLKLGIYADADYRVEEGDWINLTGLDWSDGVVNVNIYPPPAPLPLDEWTYYYIAADGSLYNDRELCDLAVAAPNGTPLPSPTAPPAATPPGYCRQPLALNDITDARIGITRSSYNYGYKYEIFSAEEPGHDNRWFYLYDRLNVYHDDPGVPGSYLKLGIYADADYGVEEGDWINLTGLDWSGGVVNVNVYPPPAPLPLDEWTYYYIAADGSLYHDRELCDLAVAAPNGTPLPSPTAPPAATPPGYCRQPLALNDITDARIGITRSSYNYGYKYEIFSAEEPGHDNRWFYLYDRVNVYHDDPGVPGSYLKLGIYADADYRVEQGDWINLTGLDWSGGVVNVNVYPPPAPLPLDEWTYYYIAADGSLYHDRELCDLAVAAPAGTPLPSPTAPPAATPPGYCRQPLALNDITDARIGITRSSYNYGYKYEIFSAEEPGHDNRWFYLYDRVNVYHDDPGVPGSYLKLGIYADADYRVEQGDWINLTGLDWSGGVVNVNVYPPPAPLPLDEWTYYYIAADGSLYHDRELCDLAVAAPNGTPLPSPTAPPATTPLPTVSPVLTPTETPEQVIIVCLGDSVTHGAPYADNGNPHLTYPARLSVLLEAGYGEGGFAVHNQGVNGYRAEDVVNDLLQPGALDEDPDYVLLMIGGNDLAGATIGNIFQVIEETTWEVQSCVNLVKSHTNPDGSSPRVILSAFIPNLVEDGWGTLAVGFYNNSLLSNLEGYDLWTGENWEDLYDPDTGEAKQSLMFDDVHPNSDGYQVLAENWFNAIQTMLPASPTPAPGSSP